MASDLDALAKQLSATAESLRNNPKALDGKDKERAKLVESAEALLHTIKPTEFFFNALVNIIQLTVFRLFIGWKVFDTIPTDGSILISDLAAAVNADRNLIVRLSNVLVATGILKQEDPSRLAHTDESIKYVSASPMAALMQMGFDDHLRFLSAMPRYFDEYGRKEPAGKYHTITAFSEGDPTLTVWEHMNRNPERKTRFMISMAAAASRMPMTGSYDYSWVIGKADEDPKRALVVDVGGGQGHALQAILNVTPGLPASRCVVEDLDVIVEEAKATATGDLKEVQYVGMDFHKEQPVKGALIYYIRRCLHDYGDDDCVDILRQLQQAMTDQSRVLIVEQVYTNPPTAFAAATDIIISSLGGKERTVEGFEDITTRAGLKIAKVHATPGSDVAVIECVKV